MAQSRRTRPAAPAFSSVLRSCLPSPLSSAQPSPAAGPRRYRHLPGAEGLFRVAYDDGDSEDLVLDELLRLPMHASEVRLLPSRRRCASGRPRRHLHSRGRFGGAG